VRLNIWYGVVYGIVRRTPRIRCRNGVTVFIVAGLRVTYSTRIAYISTTNRIRRRVRIVYGIVDGTTVNMTPYGAYMRRVYDAYTALYTIRRQSMYDPCTTLICVKESMTPNTAPYTRRTKFRVKITLRTGIRNVTRNVFVYSSVCQLSLASVAIANLLATKERIGLTVLCTVTKAFVKITRKCFFFYYYKDVITAKILS